jgi:RHS repeat-associated protein
VKAWQRYPFGEGNESNGGDEYATYPIDRSTGHYYAWNRFYSATWGRFSSPDPYVMSGGLTNPQGWNRYSYVANDPVNYYDPEGLFARCPIGTHSAGYVCVIDDTIGVEYEPTKASDSFTDPIRNGVAFNPKIVRLDKDKLVAGVEELLSREDCANFVATALQRGFLDVNQVPSADQLGEYERSVYNSLGKDLLLVALNTAIFQEGGAAPTQRVGTETFTTVATVKYSSEKPSIVIFYDPFFDKNTTEQYQTTLHEGVHLIWNISDDNIARALGIAGKTGVVASAAWHKRLTDKCK